MPAPPQPSPHEQIEFLRSLLRERPRNAKAMARLSCLLVEHAKTESKFCKDKSEDEASLWARKSINIAPHKPFGHAALSVASSEHRERMDALKRAVDLTEPSDEMIRDELASAPGFCGALVRLLVEPREEEGRRLRTVGGIGRGSPKHPCRRDLDANERMLYNRVLRALERGWNAENISETTTAASSDALYLCRVEYRLGIFFRKLDPGKVHRIQSQKHFHVAAQKLPPNHPLSTKARFWLATFALDDPVSKGDNSRWQVAMDGIDRCPEEYVVSLYSSFASNFDELLVTKLQYETPTILRRMVDDAVGWSNEQKHIWARNGADLGCGTGLSGLAFRNCIHHMIGVDLSPEMVDRARERKCYDRLVVGDLECVLHRSKGGKLVENGESFDLIFACDVFVYIGDLRSVFESAWNNLIPGCGLFAFSTELLEEGETGGGQPYVLQACARFAHKRSYIEGLAMEFGFGVKKMKVSSIRKNKGVDVIGLLAVLCRK